MEKPKRPDLEETYMEVARIFAKRSSCLSRQVGAVIVKDGHVISTGYNGAPKGVSSCIERGVCIRKEAKSGEKLNQCYAAHAEQNAIAHAAYHGVSTKDATIYCTTQPCTSCAKLIINAGIKTVIYDEPYPDEFGMFLLDAANVGCFQFKKKTE